LELPADTYAQISACLEETVSLFDHQKKAIMWMLQKERSDAATDEDLPPFYTAVRGKAVAGSSDTSYLHSLTRHSYKTKPKNVRGGMLCDEMVITYTIFLIA
jgi:hypothetical protein